MKSKWIISALAVLSFFGCATSQHKLDTNEALARQYLTQQQKQTSIVQQKSEYYVDVQDNKAYQKQRYLQQLKTQSIVMHHSFHSIESFVTRLRHLTQIPISIDTSLSQEMIKNQKRLKQLLRIDYEGNVSGLLTYVCGQIHADWEMTNESVQLYRFKTKTFRVMALPGNTQLKNIITNATGSSDTTSQSTTENERSSKGGAVTEAKISVNSLSVWTSLEKSIQAMLSPNGKVIVTPATATVSVTDTPSVLQRVEQYIEQQNLLLSQRVHLHVRVVSVDLSKSDQYGINWDVLYASVRGHLGMQWQSAFNRDDTANLTFRVLSGKNGSVWSGSQAILSALSQQGRVSNLTSATLSTLNNQPVPLQVGRQIAYLKRSSTTLTDGSLVSNALDPGTINTGFTLSVLPQVIDVNHLILQFSVDMSSLVSLNQVSTGTSMIQTPEVDTRNFLQRVKMTHGDTLVVTGFEQNITNHNQSGVGRSTNVWFGGNLKHTKDNTIMVIIIQACIGE